MSSIGLKRKELFTWHCGCHGNQDTIATRYVTDAYCPKEAPCQIYSENHLKQKSYVTISNWWGEPGVEPEPRKYSSSLQHGLYRLLEVDFELIRPRFWAGKDNIFHLVTRPPPIFSNFAGKTVTRLGLARSIAQGLCFSNLSYFWR